MHLQQTLPLPLQACVCHCSIRMLMPHSGTIMWNEKIGDASRRLFLQALPLAVWLPAQPILAAAFKSLSCRTAIALVALIHEQTEEKRDVFNWQFTSKQLMKFKASVYFIRRLPNVCSDISNHLPHRQGSNTQERKSALPHPQNQYYQDQTYTFLIFLKVIQASGFIFLQFSLKHKLTLPSLNKVQASSSTSKSRLFPISLYMAKAAIPRTVTWEEAPYKTVALISE